MENNSIDNKDLLLSIDGLDKLSLNLKNERNKTYELIKELNILKQNNKLNENIINKQNKQIDEYINIINQLNKQLDDKNNEIVQLNQLVNQIKLDLNDHLNENISYNQRTNDNNHLNHQNDVKQMYEEIILNLRNEIESLVNEKNSKQIEETNRFDQQIKNLAKVNSELVSELDRYKAIDRENKADVESLKESNGNLISKINELNQTLDQVNKEKNDLIYQSINNDIKTIEKLNNIINELKNENFQLEKNKNENFILYNKIKEENYLLNIRINVLNESILNLNKELDIYRHIDIYNISFNNELTNYRIQQKSSQSSPQTSRIISHVNTPVKSQQRNQVNSQLNSPIVNDETNRYLLKQNSNSKLLVSDLTIHSPPKQLTNSSTNRLYRHIDNNSNNNHYDIKLSKEERILLKQKEILKQVRQQLSNTLSS